MLDEGDAALWWSSAVIVAWVVQYSVLAEWWRNLIGITIVGLAICLLLVYIPSLMALAWPEQFATFAQTVWYKWLAIVIVNATAVFMTTRIWAWEQVRRRRGVTPLLPSDQAKRIAELETENAGLRQQIEEIISGP